MASIRKRGENSYLLVVSRGYDYQGNRLKPAQKTVHPPKGLTAKQTEKWLNEQAVLYEREVKHTPGESVDRSITLKNTSTSGWSRWRQRNWRPAHWCGISRISGESCQRWGITSWQS